jgi:putative hydrolase of the HAD superfamily
VPVDAVIFDWGGTLTPWKTMDGLSWSRIADALARAGVIEPGRAVMVGEQLGDAEELIWQRARDDHRSGTLAEVLATAGLTADEAFYAIHTAEHDWATYTDREAAAVLTELRRRGIRVGLLSNTIWTRAQHERILVRDGLFDLIDGAVYTGEIAWTKPHPEAFRAAMAAVGVDDPSGCVMVGDRLFDDIFGAQQVGMRTVHIPHSDIPTVQRGHTQGEPNAVIHRLSELLDLVDAWQAEEPPPPVRVEPASAASAASDDSAAFEPEQA